MREKLKKHPTLIAVLIGSTIGVLLALTSCSSPFASATPDPFDVGLGNIMTGMAAGTVGTLAPVKPLNTTTNAGGVQ